jgi:hypothetical protein
MFRVSPQEPPGMHIGGPQAPKETPSPYTATPIPLKGHLLVIL